MKITFLGATRTVTGSNFLVEGAGKKFWSGSIHGAFIFKCGLSYRTGSPGCGSSKKSRSGVVR